MPRYFFNVYDGHPEPDLEGTEFPDIRAAQAAAVQMSGAIMRDLGAKFWKGDDWRLEVTDENQRTLFIVRFSAEDVS